MHATAMDTRMVGEDSQYLGAAFVDSTGKPLDGDLARAPRLVEERLHRAIARRRLGAEIHEAVQ